MNKIDSSLEINLFSKFLISMTIILSLYSGYLDTSMPAFIVLAFLVFLNLHHIKINLAQLFIIFIFLIYISVIIINSLNPISTLSNIKWFYGIMFFLLIFNIKHIKSYLINFLSSERTFIFFILLIITETIAINFLFQPIYLYGEEFSGSTLGVYNRPLGPTGNSPMTATLTIAWYYSFNREKLSNKRYILLLYSLTILLAMSGTGFILYFIGLIVDQRNRFVKLLSIQNLFIAVTLVTIFLIGFLNSVTQKMSINYYTNVLTEKFFFFNSLTLGKDGSPVFSNDIFTNLFGFTNISEVPLNGGDFAWLDLLHAHGILGFLIFFLILWTFKKDRIEFRLPIVILLLGAFHYAALFNAGGQLLLSRFLEKK